jgi:hypothetical protein
VAISDLVLLHNKATEAQAKNNPIGLDLFDKIPDVKREFLKFCRHFEQRLRRNVAKHRVIAKNEEQCTDIMIPGFIIENKARGAKKLGPAKINLQFLEHHKDQFLELHRDLAKISHSPQTDAALTNTKTLIQLELSLLMGCDIDWAGASDLEDPPVAAEVVPVLPAAAANDDDDNSSNDNTGEGAAAADPANNAGPRAAANNAGPRAASAAPAAPSAAPATPSAAPAAAPAGAGGAGGACEDDAPDPTDFTTWTPENWPGLDFNLFTFPADPFVSICSVRVYHAVAILLVHVPSLRTAHPRVWGELNTAWHNTFHSDLSETALDKWPTFGPHAFSTAQGHWLTETLRYLKSLKPGPALRRRTVPPSPAEAAAQYTSHKSQKSKAGGAQGKHRRDSDPVQNTSR